MCVSKDGNRLCVDDLLGRVINLEEACKGTAFLSRIHKVSRFEDTHINIHALHTGLVIRVHQGVEPHRFVEMTIPIDNSEMVEFVTSEGAIVKCNKEIGK